MNAFSVVSLIGVGGFFAVARALTEQRLRVIEVRTKVVELFEQEQTPEFVASKLRVLHVDIRHALGPEKEELLEYIQKFQDSSQKDRAKFVDGLYDRFDLYTAQHIRNYVRFAFTGKRRTH